VLRIFGRRSGGGQRQYCLGWLVIPHLARLLVGVDHRRLLPCAFWLGGGFMIVDDIARTLMHGDTAGIITALFGAPLFAFLLIRTSRREKS
jgi:iron complex transport system permease protein